MIDTSAFTCKVCGSELPAYCEDICPVCRGKRKGVQAVPRHAGDLVAERYHLIRQLGCGGMGEVWLAIEAQTWRESLRTAPAPWELLALRGNPDALAPLAARLEEEVRKLGAQSPGLLFSIKFTRLRQVEGLVLERFRSERRQLSRLRDPHIAQVKDATLEDHGEPLLVMEYVDGEKLTAYCDRRRLSIEQRLELFLDVCRGVRHAHERGVVHRDLKPDNILVTELGGEAVPKIIDFGLATDQEQQRADRLGGRDAAAFAGTLAYASPEQLRGERDIDARTDVYALGVILYELLAGSTPVNGANVMQVLNTVQRGEIDWAAVKANASASLVAVCRKALAPSVISRYAFVAELQADIAAYQVGFATSAENAGAWTQFKLLIKRNKAVSAGAAAVLAVGAVFGAKAIIEGQRAEQALANLRRSAPVFAEQARSLAARQQFSEALARIDAALAIAPDDAAFHFERGSLLQISDRFTDAQEAFIRARKLSPSLPLLAESIVLNERLLSETALNGEISTSLLTDWLKICQAGSRPGEALAIAQRAKLESSAQLPIYQTRLEAWLGKDAPKIKRRSNKLFELQLKDLPISDLSPLAGMQIHYLNLADLPVSDLTPLKDMPLRGLTISKCRVKDLAPLAGMKIEDFSLAYVGRIDFQPLKDWPLKTLDLMNTHPISLEPLRGKQITKFSTWDAGLESIEPLRGMQITQLGLHGSPIRSLDPLVGMPLKQLRISSAKVTDITALAGMPLEMLTLPPKPVDLTPLLSCPELRSIHLLKKHPSVEKLRSHPALKHISYKDMDQPAAEFWADYDAEDK